MSRDIPVGILIGTATASEHLAALCARAEDRGFDEVWVAEEYFGYGGFSAAAIALSATGRIDVGLGIVNTVSRHPAVTAMEIATLARAFPGRFLPAVGHGAPWRLDLRPRSPLGALEAAVTSIRALLEGETLDRPAGPYAFHGVTLPHRAEPPVPLLTGVMRPRSLALSGRVADGTVMSVLCGPRYLEESLAHIRTGMAQGGRDRHLVPTYVLCHVDEDGDRARAAVRPLISYYLARIGADNPLSAAYGYGPAIADMVERGGAAVVEREMPDEWITNLAMAGTPEEVATGIRRFAEVGATSVVAVPLVDRTAEQLDALAETVLPLLN